MTIAILNRIGRLYEWPIRARPSPPSSGRLGSKGYKRLKRKDYLDTLINKEEPAG